MSKQEHTHANLEMALVDHGMALHVALSARVAAPAIDVSNAVGVPVCPKPAQPWSGSSTGK